MKADEIYLGCHIHVDTLVSRTSQPEAGGCDLLNSKTTQRSDAIFIIQINLEKKN